MVMPASAVQRGPQGTFVYVVGADGKAQQRAVEVALTVGDVAIIGKGLDAGRERRHRRAEPAASGLGAADARRAAASRRRQLDAAAEREASP